MSLYDDLLPAVEQQLLSSETPFVAKTLKRLTEKENLEEDRAKQLIAEALGLAVDQMYKKRREFDQKFYKDLLQNLPDIPDQL